MTFELPESRKTAVCFIGVAMLLFPVAFFLAGGFGFFEWLLCVLMVGVGVVILAWELQGHESVTIDEGVVRISARVGRWEVSDRTYPVGEISNLRADKRLFHPFNRFENFSASGLPWTLGQGMPSIRFEYQGRDLGFGDAIDYDEAVTIVERMRDAMGLPT